MHNIIFKCSLLVNTLVFASLGAMETEQRADLKRERTEILRISTEELKRSKSNQTVTLIRHIPHIGWATALIEGTNVETLSPYELLVPLELQVEPIVKAVYEDDLETVKQLCLSPSTDLLCVTQGLVDARENATILDVAADRKAIGCLAFFRKILSIGKPEATLEKIVCYEIKKGNFTQQAQEQFPHVDIVARAKSGELIYLYPIISNTLRVLYSKARQRAYQLAKESGDIKVSRLLLPLEK
jgi:hypothetical protein